MMYPWSPTSLTPTSLNLSSLNLSSQMNPTSLLNRSSPMSLTNRKILTWTMFPTFPPKRPNSTLRSPPTPIPG